MFWLCGSCGGMSPAPEGGTRCIWCGKTVPHVMSKLLSMQKRVAISIWACLGCVSDTREYRQPDSRSVRCVLCHKTEEEVFDVKK